MYRRRATSKRSPKNQTQNSKQESFPALKKQVEIDLEYHLYVTEGPDEDRFLQFHEDDDPGPFDRIVPGCVGAG